MSFEKALAITLEFEGGYVHDPRDHGGATNKGITQRCYDAYCDDHGIEHRPIETIPDWIVKEIYKTYWSRGKCAQMKEPLDACVFDTAVNCGVKEAIEILQKTLNVDVDGEYGPNTEEKLKLEMKDVKNLATRYLDCREDHYHAIVNHDHSQEVFLKGWINRVNTLRELTGLSK